LVGRGHHTSPMDPDGPLKRERGVTADLAHAPLIPCAAEKIVILRRALAFFRKQNGKDLIILHNNPSNEAQHTRMF